VVPRHRHFQTLPYSARICDSAGVVNRDEDPGWPLRAELLLALIPGVGRLLLRRRAAKSANGLVLLRQLFVNFCLAIVTFGVVLVFLWPSQSKEAPSPGLALGLVVLGAGAGIVMLFIEKPLNCESLAGSYRVRFFLRMALSEVASLFGFVGFFVASVWWVYPVGAAITLLGFARAAPTRSHLRRDQERLREHGCFQSLVAALSAPPGPATGAR
jgi:hypothetical protein